MGKPSTTHTYVLGNRGRRIAKIRAEEHRPTSPFETFAKIECTKCNEEGGMHLNKLLPEDVIDNKFKQIGWSLDPHVCPKCQREQREKKATLKLAFTNDTKTKDNDMALSPAAIKSHVRLVRMLDEHFDADTGQYMNGWNDEKVAAETGLSLAVVTEYRREAYGELKLPPGIQSLKDDIAVLELAIKDFLEDARQKHNALITDLNALNARLAKALKEFPK
jgi:hypothetical protein